ncbi:MAG TPA: hypothetical protein VK146_13675 [Tabrizicola sp.]|nr:hypothetical protein [Tabrizicola sp.]
MRLAVALFLALAAPLVAETRQHGNVIFDIPQGWVLGGLEDDGTLILRSDLPDEECEYCRIWITPGTRATGRADTWVASQTRRFTDPDETPKITTLVKPELTNLSGRPAALLGQKVDSDLQVLFAIQLFGRMELIGFEASAWDEADLAEGMRVFERDVVPLVAGARFVSEGAKPLLPPPEAGPLTGLYWGTSTSWMMQLDGTMQMQLDHHFLVFWPDGRFYEGTPPQGLATFDPAPALDQGDMDWGNYRIKGDVLSLSYASGETSELSLNGEALVRGEATLYQVEPLPDGTKVNGTLSTFFYTGFTPGSGLQGGVSASNEITFNPEGTWTRESSGGASASFVDGAGTTTGGMTVGNSASDRGRYEVKDGLIIRTPDDGSQPQTALIFKSGNDIMIGELPLE